MKRFFTPFFLLICMDAAAQKADSVLHKQVEKEGTVQGTRISIRCKTGEPVEQPLFLIDGRQVQPDIVSTLQPENIREITVLKGESALTIFGADGRHGAVLISTKSFSTDTSRSFSGLLIRDQDNIPVPAATVTITAGKKRKQVRAVTDVNGYANIDNLKDVRQIEVSCIGYKTKTLTDFKSYGKIVNLERDYRMMDEVIIRTYPVIRCGFGCGILIKHTICHNDTIPEQKSFFSVFPNPASANSVIKIKSIAPFDGQVSITNTAGQVMQRSYVISNKNLVFDIPIKQLGAGMYFIQMNDVINQKTSVQKLLIQ